MHWPRPELVELMHVDDLAAAYLAALTRAQAGTAYAVVDDEPLRLRLLTDLTTDALARPRVGTAPPALISLILGRTLSTASLPCSSTARHPRNTSWVLRRDSIAQPRCRSSPGCRARGLVSRGRDPANRRAYLVTLTETGEQLRARASHVLAACDDRFLAALTPRERTRLRSTLFAAALSRPLSRFGLWLLFDLSPAAGSVVRADLAQHGGEWSAGDGAVAVEGDRAGGLVVVAAGDDVVGVGHDGAVVEEQVDVVLAGQQCAHVTVEHEVGLHRAFDRLLDVGFGGVNQVAQLAAQIASPIRQSVEVVVDAGVSLVVLNMVSP